MVQERKTSHRTPSRDDLVHEGATVSDLKDIFVMTSLDIRNKMGSLKPVGERNGFPIYSIKAAARRLITPDFNDDEDVIERVMRMRVDDLPDKLRKNYYDTERAKDEMQVRRKELFATPEIISMVGGALKAIRLALMLLPDTLQREAAITEAQHLIVTRIVDEILAKAHKDMLDGFANGRNDPFYPEASPDEDDPAADL